LTHTSEYARLYSNNIKEAGNVPISLKGQKYYRTAETCSITGISRATLFRWLKEGILGEAEKRDRRGWRLFSEDDVTTIKDEAAKVIKVTNQRSEKSVDILPHILVVDDEPVVGQLFKDALRERPCQVTAITDSRRALELIQKKRFDLIFLDLNMPKLDGSDLFRHIRKLHNDTPVAIITGYPDSELMAKALEQGPFLVMKKPFHSSDVLHLVRDFLQSRLLKVGVER
jgi:CheY-like chemotaxis protein